MLVLATQLAKAMWRADHKEGPVRKKGYLHPLGRLPRFVASDRKKIWTSPFHTTKQDAKYWAIFGGATGVLIAFDELTLIPLSAGFYFLGSKADNQRLREVGLMSFEALVAATVVEEVLKVATDRDDFSQHSANTFAGSADMRKRSGVVRVARAAST